ncbi:hypothetical protein HHK36_024240 [Tetracentron sinense]|uniref:Uncharacterized protein n=1 Tax=Tetracentron sinense TaxID=13715 RepID=A0A834YQ74_TETSI|nr:hypothetical protein HHK36_024240 [Tetracentron sinense]
MTCVIRIYFKTAKALENKPKQSATKNIISVARLTKAYTITQVIMGKQAHVLVVPFPAQGHVMPLMNLSHRLVDAGVKVTFLNAEFIHAQIMATSTEKRKEHSAIHLVSVPDGFEPGDDRKDPLKLMEIIPRVMPGHLEDLIRKMQQSVEDHDHITCIIADTTAWWALEIAEKLGIKGAAFWPGAVGVLTLIHHIPKFIEAGIMDSNDAQVIYVAFGSTTIFNQHQFDELALGLELIGRPFLWVVRPDLTDGSVIVYPNGFRDRVAHHGEMIKWAPQQKVLAHPSIACFLTHCGWNSTMDGLSMGVPFICWPYFTDQFHNRSCICDIWNVGLGLNPDEDGIISRHEIQSKVEKLLFDEGIRANSLRLKETARKCVSEGGSSWKNFEGFIEQIKF